MFWAYGPTPTLSVSLSHDVPSIWKHSQISRAVLQTEREKVIREMSHRENRQKNSLLFSLSRTKTHATITLNMTKDSWSTHSFLHLASAWYFKGKDKQKNIYQLCTWKKTNEGITEKKNIYMMKRKKTTTIEQQFCLLVLKSSQPQP